MTAERLLCRCGIEVGIVRLNAETLTLGHKVNPRNHRHPVRLARDAAVSAVPAVEVPQPHREVPDTRRGHAPDPGTSHRPALAPRASSEGRVSPTTPMPVDLQPSSGGRARRAGVPLSRSVSPSPGRSRPTAGDHAPRALHE